MTIAKTKYILLGIIFAVTSLLPNCLISYRDFPKIPPVPAREKNLDMLLVYNLPNFPQLNLGGRDALKEFFSSKTQFRKTEEGSEAPKLGYLVDVKVNYRSPSQEASVFLALSTLTATFLPAWSTKDGYDVTYTLYKDGKKLNKFEYHIYRNYYQWILFIPVIWLNYESASEKEVFERTTLQFFEDAKSQF